MEKNSYNSVEEFKRFKDQIWNYFQYKKAEKEKKHGFQSFIGTAEAQFLDGGWNADNWIKKNKKDYFQLIAAQCIYWI